MRPAPVRRVHRMPFGAQFDRGGVRFRLWAPAARSVDLLVGQGAGLRALRMTCSGDGWYALWLQRAGAGMRYAFRVDDGPPVPDPASRCNPDDVHGPSMVVDPATFHWHDAAWRGMPWAQAVIYELHVGTFTPKGTFAAAIDKLDHLAATGITVVELMPVANFPGRRNWGYDGVLPFAPDTSYGKPDDLRRLVAAAHARGIAMLLDVVYNHFGPDGNHLVRYAPPFFSRRRRTPWGAAIDFDGPQSRTVRDFFIHNALYWLEEFHFDGLRLDAVEAIRDASRPDIVEEIAHAIRAGPGRERHVHLVLENRRTVRRHLERTRNGKPRCATAQWNDDLHHAAHVLGTGESDGYYARYRARPLAQFARTLAGGTLDRRPPDADRDVRQTPLPPTAFVAYLQNHDQVGNRPHGERLTRLMPRNRLQVLLACVLLAPAVPMLFMGEEWGTQTPFLFFCDFGEELARAIDTGRRQGFARFAHDPEALVRTDLANPNDVATFHACKLDWSELHCSRHAQWHGDVRTLLALRRARIAPHLAGRREPGWFELPRADLLRVAWPLAHGLLLRLVAHLPADPSAPAADLGGEPGELVHAVSADARRPAANWSARWTIARSPRRQGES